MELRRYRLRRALLAFSSLLVLGVATVGSQLLDSASNQKTPAIPEQSVSAVKELQAPQNDRSTDTALEALENLLVKGRAPKTNYDRAHFGTGWQSVAGCDMRNRILARDLTDAKFVDTSACLIQSGSLQDPYTNNMISFTRGNTTSSLVQIDHVVALSDAWQKGAQALTPELRQQLANDPLELLAVDGPTNMKKSDGDAASWLPPNKAFRCQYIARQIAVKIKYTLWVTEAEKNAMKQVLNTCPQQILPQP